MLVLRALHLFIRVFLVLAGAIWLLIVLELAPVLAFSGMDGVRGKLLRIWNVNHDIPWICQDSLSQVHEGYTDIILFLLLTWAAVELKRFLSRRLVETARLSQIPADNR